MLTAADFDYQLAPDRIADRPAEARDQARLLVVNEHSLHHHKVAELPALLSAHVGERTLLVLNDTKVLPARLRGYKLRDDGSAGGRIELLLLQPVAGLPGGPPGQKWRAMYRASKPLHPGQKLRLSSPSADSDYTVAVSECSGGEAVLDFGALDAAALDALLQRIGEVPLPPYIERVRQQKKEFFSRDEDRRRYQTVYARSSGSVAAPTAGLHFTPELLAALRAAGHDYVSITLHVGPGTFVPLRSDSIAEHVMHPERYHVSEEAAAALAAARRDGRPVLAVGTTVVRTLESATPAGATAPTPGWGETRLFIHPPYQFAAVDALLTNFHLPRSTLLMLVAALTGRDRLLSAYATAIAEGYRFYSFGDAMLIPRRLAEAPL